MAKQEKWQRQISDTINGNAAIPLVIAASGDPIRALA